LVEDLIRSLEKTRHSPARLRGCVRHSQLPLFLR
jgi:hypothetical protein